MLELLRRWGAKQSQGMSVEFIDRNAQLPMAYRNTIANMMAEAEALNGIFVPDDISLAWYRAKGITDLPYPPVQPGADARYEIDETLDLSGVRPMIAKPFSPGNAFPATDVARGGSRSTRRSSAHAPTQLRRSVIRRPGDSRGPNAAPRAPRRRSSSFRDRAVSRGRSSCPMHTARRSRLRGVPIGRRRGAAVVVRPVLRQGPDAPGEGRRAITSFNRNWQNRMGLGGEGYLASPAVVAASALLGYMAPPDELGLSWNPEDFGV